MWHKGNLIGCISLLLALCTSCYSSESTTADSDASPLPSPSVSSSILSNDNHEEDLVTEYTAYSFPYGVYNANQFFTVEELSLPQTIDGLDLSFYFYISDDELVVQLYDSIQQCEFGTLNLNTAEYKKLFDVEDHLVYNLLCTDGRFIVYRCTDSSTETQSLGFFDRLEMCHQEVYVYNSKYANSSAMGNRVLILNNCLYFDDVILGETGEVERIKLLQYDFSTRTVSPVQEDAQNPMLLHGDLAFISGPDQNGAFSVVPSSGETLPLDKRVAGLASTENELYACYNKELNKLGNTVWSINNLTEGKELLTSNIAIDRINANSLAITWVNYMEETPVLYLRDPGCCVLFSELGKAYNFFQLKDDELFLLCTHDSGPNQYYRITPK